MNIYVHIPFCRSKCAYCAFLSFVTPEREKYLTRLLSEIDERAYFGVKKPKSKDKVANSIYFGGGTPSILDKAEFDQVMRKIKSKYDFTKDIEATIEVNPEDITDEKLKMWREGGINRLSIGVQSLDDDVRCTIGRNLLHDEVIDKIKLAKKYFQNISLDFIAGLPGESLDNFLAGLKEIAKLDIKHISVYDLEIEENSKFHKNKDDYVFLDEDQREIFLEKSWKLLEKLGYEQYEISNFAKKGYQCQHNLSFWHGNDYIGFGLGAASRDKNRLISNNYEFNKYFKNYVSKEEIYDEKQVAEFVIILALRLDEDFGAVIKNYEQVANKSVENNLKYLQKKGLVKGGKLTKKGKLLYNFVISMLLT